MRRNVPHRVAIDATAPPSPSDSTDAAIAAALTPASIGSDIRALKRKRLVPPKDPPSQRDDTGSDRSSARMAVVDIDTVRRKLEETLACVAEENRRNATFLDMESKPALEDIRDFQRQLAVAELLPRLERRAPPRSHPSQQFNLGSPLESIPLDVIALAALVDQELRALLSR